MQGLSSTTVVGTLTVMLMCTGCAEQNEPAARAAAEIFADDLASGDGAGACRVLAPPSRRLSRPAQPWLPCTPRDPRSLYVDHGVQGGGIA
jgi:hypothetical protein